MTFEELKQVLQEIKDECSEHKFGKCDGCKFYSKYGCTLKHIPEEWNLDNIGLAESEDKE